MQIVLRKFVHKVSGIISFDCYCYYSDTQQHSTFKLGNAQKRKMHVQLESIHLLNVSLKIKTENFFITIRHVTTEKRAKGIFMLQKVLVDDKKTIFHKCLQNQDFCLQMSQFMTKQTEIIIFRSQNFSDACIQ